MMAATLKAIRMPLTIVGVQVMKQSIVLKLSDRSHLMVFIEDVAQLNNASDMELRAIDVHPDRLEWPVLGLKLTLDQMIGLYQTAAPPPIDNDHVANGALQFSPEEIDAAFGGPSAGDALAYTLPAASPIVAVRAHMFAAADKQPRNEDVNALAAAAAASIAFGTTNQDNHGFPFMDVAWMVGEAEGPTMTAASQAAASFLRRNADAPPAAARIELTRKKIARPLESPRAIVAWEIFAETLRRLDRLDADEKAAAEAAEREKTRTRPVLDSRDAALMPRQTFSR